MSNSFDPERARSSTSFPTGPLIFHPEEGMEVFGLRLVRRLGAGAMGEVWLAVDPQRAGDGLPGCRCEVSAAGTATEAA